MILNSSIAWSCDNCGKTGLKLSAAKTIYCPFCNYSYGNGLFDDYLVYYTGSGINRKKITQEMKDEMAALQKELDIKQIDNDSYTKTKEE